jgi:ribosome biogenesis protein NSA1
MRVLTGDECGLLKEFVPEIAHAKQQSSSSSDPKKDIVLPTHYDIMQKINTQHGIQRVALDEPQSRTRGVISLTMVHDDDDDDNDKFTFAALRHNGSVQLWQGTKQARGDSNNNNHQKNKFAHYQPLAQPISGNIFETIQAKSAILDQVPATPLAMQCTQSKTDPRLVACDTHGHVVILKVEEEEKKSLSILHQFSALTNTPDNITLTYTKGNVLNRQFASAMALHSNNNTVAIGGRERDVRLLDLETGKATWKAKNLPPDPQTLLQQPIWPSAMTFWNTTSSTPPLLAVGTAFGQVRLYDVRIPPHQTTSLLRRPIQYTPLEDAGVHDHRITAICPISPFQIVAGDTTGDLHALDLRYNFHGQRANKQIDGAASTGRFVGPTGSIRQLVKHKTLPLLAVVGCDRMLRTYDTNKQKTIDCVYLKQRLNCVLLCSEERMDDEEDDTKEDADVDQEDIVRDYVDSDDDEDDDTTGMDNGRQHQVNKVDDESDSDSDDEKERIPAGSNKNTAKQNSDDDESDAKNQSVSGSGSATGSSDSDEDDDDEDESSSEDETPQKRRRR